MELFYFADPMCSWCWGFAPVIEQVEQRYRDRAPLRVFAGGLAVGTTKQLNDRVKTSIAEHWRHVNEASGQPFNDAFFDREGFVYDSEPACQALVAARQEELDALGFLRALHSAFYTENRDITSRDVLLDVAAEFGAARDAFSARFDDPACVAEMHKDFELTQQLGIEGFPTLLGFAEQRLTGITMGYQSYDELIRLVDAWYAGASTAKPQS